MILFIMKYNVQVIKGKKLKKNLKILDLTNYEISKIFGKNNKNHIPLIKYIEELNLKTKYLYSSKSKNYIYYACYKKISNCKGTG